MIYNERKHIGKKEEITNKRYIIYYLILYLIIISFPISNQKNLNKLIHISEINLVIKGKNNQPILNNKSYEIMNPNKMKKEIINLILNPQK